MMWPASAALRDAVQSSAYHPWRSRTPDTLRTDWRYLMNYLNPAGLVRTKLKDADFPKKNEEDAALAASSLLSKNSTLVEGVTLLPDASHLSWGKHIKNQLIQIHSHSILILG